MKYLVTITVRRNKEDSEFISKNIVTEDGYEDFDGKVVDMIDTLEQKEL